MILVIVESPYSGDVERNERYARACMKDSLSRGEAPYASHLLYTQAGVLDDTVAGERSLGMAAGFAWGRVAELAVVYTDLGITEGMLEGIDRHLANGLGVIHRDLGEEWAYDGKEKAEG